MKKNFKKPQLSMVAIKSQPLLVDSIVSGGGNGNGKVGGAKVAGPHIVGSTPALSF